MKARNITVSELVKRVPVTVKPELTVDKAAVVMKDEGIGSLIILKKKKPIGILTERDIVTKIVAEGKEPKKVKVNDIMSEPLISVSPDLDIYEAARKMAALEIRRLPIIDERELKGMITETDLLRISPDLISITREIVTMQAKEEEKLRGGLSGYCESCQAFSNNLRVMDGMLLCQD
jgi:CBS domain-containing protein